jgi:phosphatidylglycerol lysyltransferase
MKSRVLKILVPIFGLAVLSLALYLLYHELKTYHLRDILKEVEALPAGRILLSLLFVSGSYLAATGYDTLSSWIIRHHLPYRQTALASFIGTSFSNNLGFGPLTGGSVRLRLYSAWGLSAAEITKMVFFNTITLWLGYFALGGLFFTLEPLALPQTLHFPLLSLRPLGLAFLAVTGTYLAFVALRRRPLKIRSHELIPPPPRFLPIQVLISVFDWGCAGAALYVLLPPAIGLTFPAFFGLYLLALIAGIVSQVPGGLGVFETVFVLMLSTRLPASTLLGTLLAYRGLYYLLPLFLAVLLLTLQELMRKRALLAGTARQIERWSSIVVPPLLAVASFIAGAVLLVSGATPAVEARISRLLKVLPFPVIEVSHFLGSMVGVGLLVLARGIQRRIDAAYPLAVILLGSGIVLSLLKGLDYEEAIILAVMLAALLPTRRFFYRKSSLLRPNLSASWIFAILFVLGFTVWLTLFSYKHVEYSRDLWWQFAADAHAPRSLRALVAAGAVAFAFALGRLFQPLSERPVVEPLQKDREQIRKILELAPETTANLALLGDKKFLFSEQRDAFLMYNTVGRSWISMGDPIGPAEQRQELAWVFRELCDRHNGWTVFYEVGTDSLPLYLDMGLAMLKLGEEARVPLDGFSLEGSSRKHLRHTCNNLGREGNTFEVLRLEQVPRVIPDLKMISDAWLTEKKTREKGFSLGFFCEKYLEEFPVAVIRRNGRIVAFANVWTTASKEEISIDLMRFHPDAPEGVMEFLFIQLMLWARQSGYHWFNLGMAPLAGLENRPLAPAWHRLASLLYRHGENFYNFQGLRLYKEKFDPLWSPRYLASPGGLALARIFVDLATLISGGLKGIVAK